MDHTLNPVDDSWVEPSVDPVPTPIVNMAVFTGTDAMRQLGLLGQHAALGERLKTALEYARGANLPGWALDMARKSIDSTQKKLAAALDKLDDDGSGEQEPRELLEAFDNELAEVRQEVEGVERHLVSFDREGDDENEDEDDVDDEVEEGPRTLHRLATDPSLPLQAVGVATGGAAVAGAIVFKGTIAEKLVEGVVALAAGFFAPVAAASSFVLAKLQRPDDSS